MCYNFISVCAVREIYHLKNICYKKTAVSLLKKMLLSSKSTVYAKRIINNNFGLFEFTTQI